MCERNHSSQTIVRQLSLDRIGSSSYKNGKLLHHDIDNISEFWEDDSVGFLSMYYV
jgi:uncharacterized protein YcsI (UPF0317 family)